MRAAELFSSGARNIDIARELGVAHQTVSDWRELWRQSGTEALKAAGRAGRMPKITREQLGAVEQALEKGARANGFATDIWTLPRVTEVIERVTGVRYHPGHVWRILRHKLGWSRQRPARRALERNEEAIESWVKHRWPVVKKRQTQRRPDRL